MNKAKEKMSKQYGQNNSKEERHLSNKMEKHSPHLEDKKCKLETMSRYYFIITKLSKITELKIPVLTMAQSMNIPAL